ncbi:MAG: type II secretion system protein [Candidatus Saccharibacteria bacterium]|nr:type II secretion system protein [Candidatus Saccharibacteria bacterium]
MAAKREQGFTLIEITLATVFVAFIITILAATTINVIRSYNKGIRLSQINTAGQQLISDINDKARYSQAATLNTSARRLCVGGVTYIWNTQQQIDNNSVGNNRYSDISGKAGYIRLARIDDPNGSYCANASSQPRSTDASVRVLLGRGAMIQEFKVTQGVSSDNSVPLLSVNAVISTEGSSRPIKAYTDSSGATKIDFDQSNSNSHWQCGNWYDNGNGKVDEGDSFEPAENQYCSFAQYNLTVYERSR